MAEKEALEDFFFLSKIIHKKKSSNTLELWVKLRVSDL